MPKDPVCGMEVDPSGPPVGHQGKEYHFCSAHCREAFVQDPDRYARAIRQTGTEIRKVVIVGAGQVGATYAFSLMISGLASSIVLIDQDASLAEGHAMDLNHGLSFAQPTRISAGNFDDCANADIVVMTAGAAQKPGETRIDLVRKNTAIFKELIPQIARHEPKILLIVTNPVDILTYVSLKISGMPMNRVIGSGTTLDTARFRFLLGQQCRLDTRNVHAYVIGEHGDSEVPVWSQVNIAGVLFTDYCPACPMNCTEENKKKLFDQVKNAAYEIIARKGATNYAIAMALVRITASLLRDENSVLTVSTLIDNYYKIEDVCLSVPAVLNRSGLSRRIALKLDDDEISKLRQSAELLKNVIRQLDI